jgi:hypothetical protein
MTYGIFTDFGTRDVVYLFDGESDEHAAQSRVHEHRNATRVLTGQRFWWCLLPANFPSLPMRRMVGGDTIRFRYPDVWEIQEADSTFKEMSIDQKIAANYYHPSEGMFKYDRKLYKREEARLGEQFVADLIRDLDMVNHPKFGALYSKAWSMGHSVGFQEVVGIARDLADLVK